MGVGAADRADVQRDRGIVRERLPEVLGELRVETWSADEVGARPAEIHVVDQERSAGEVNGHVDERFIKRHRNARETTYTDFVTECLSEHLTQKDPGVLHRVMRVDVEVAHCLDVHVDATVLGELGKHVIEERHPRVDGVVPFAVEVELDGDLGLFGVPGAGGGAGHGIECTSCGFPVSILCEEPGLEPNVMMAFLLVTRTSSRNFRTEPMPKT